MPGQGQEAVVARTGKRRRSGREDVCGPGRGFLPHLRVLERVHVRRSSRLSGSTAHRAGRTGVSPRQKDDNLKYGLARTLRYQPQDSDAASGYQVTV